MKEKEKYIIIHCTATPEGLDITAEAIRNYHLNIRKWSRPGYSLLFRLDGREEIVHPFNNDNFIDDDEVTWGILGGLNACARHYVYAGGTDRFGKSKDTRTQAQKEAMLHRLKEDIKRNPNVIIAGHNQFDQTECPGFSVPEWIKTIND